MRWALSDDGSSKIHVPQIYVLLEIYRTIKQTIRSDRLVISVGCPQLSYHANFWSDLSRYNITVHDNDERTFPGGTTYQVPFPIEKAEAEFRAMKMMRDICRQKAAHGETHLKWISRLFSAGRIASARRTILNSFAFSETFLPANCSQPARTKVWRYRQNRSCIRRVKRIEPTLTTDHSLLYKLSHGS